MRIREKVCRLVCAGFLVAYLVTFQMYLDSVEAEQ